MTPERLAEIERRIVLDDIDVFQQAKHYRVEVPELCAAVRSAWAERDALRFDLDTARRLGQIAMDVGERAAAVTEERESCAKLVESMDRDSDFIAAAIRARDKP